MDIAIIGSGNVGRATGKFFSKADNIHNVIYYDIKKSALKGLKPSTIDIEEAIENSDMAMVCVPTPTNDKGIQQDDAVHSAVDDICAELYVKEDYFTIVIRSTVLPGVTRSLMNRIEYISKKNVGVDIGLCMNPEFLTVESKTWTKDDNMKKTMYNADKIVIGEYDLKSGDILEKAYLDIHKVVANNIPIFKVSLETAELIKYASNGFLMTKTTYWNQIKSICDALNKGYSKLNIDSQEIANICALDNRIGKYGAEHGLAVGGECLPKDLEAFLTAMKNSYYYNEVNLSLLKAVKDINDEYAKNFGVRK